MNADHHLLTTSLRLSAGFGLGAVALLAGGFANASASTAAAPQLSIAVDSGRSSVVTVGDVLPYSITIRNLGGATVKGLKISQSVPPGLHFRSADLAGKSQPLGVEWSVSLKPGASATVHSTMTVTKTPPELLRLATVACAKTSAKAPPIVCASHSAQLPADAAADRAATQPSDHNAFNPWYAAGAGGALAVGVAAVVITRHRRVRPRR